MRWVIGAALRFVALGLVWLALSGADPANFAYGVIAAAAATASPTSAPATPWWFRSRSRKVLASVCRRSKAWSSASR